MKDAEKKYCRERVRSVLAARLEELKKSYTSKQVKLTAKDKLELVRNGEVTLKHNARMDWTLDQAFDFDWHEKQAELTLDEAAYRPATMELRQRADRIIDEIMVGDAKIAVKLMREFCGT